MPLNRAISRQAQGGQQGRGPGRPGWVRAATSLLSKEHLSAAWHAGVSGTQGLSPTEFATSQKDPPKDLAGILDESAQTLFLTELWRGLALTLKIYFEPSLTVCVVLFYWEEPDMGLEMLELGDI